VKPTTTMGEVFRTFAVRNNMPLESLIFGYEDQLLHPDMTVGMLGMEEEDQVHVRMVVA